MLYQVYVSLTNILQNIRYKIKVEKKVYEEVKNCKYLAVAVNNKRNNKRRRNHGNDSSGLEVLWSNERWKCQ